MNIPKELKDNSLLVKLLRGDFTSCKEAGIECTSFRLAGCWESDCVLCPPKCGFSPVTFRYGVAAYVKEIHMSLVFKQLRENNSLPKAVIMALELEGIVV